MRKNEGQEQPVDREEVASEAAFGWVVALLQGGSGIRVAPLEAGEDLAHGFTIKLIPPSE